MPTYYIADYSIFRDSPVTVQKGGGGDLDKEFRIDLPESLVRSNRSILAYVVDPESNVNNLRIEVAVNGEPVRSSRFGQDLLMTLHEVVGANVLKVGTNTVTFTATSGTGSVRISDVVLWWQRAVET